MKKTLAPLLINSNHKQLTRYNRLIFLVLFLCLYHCPLSAQNTLLWEIKGKGLNDPSYLYGTLHAKDERVFEFGESVMKAFHRCEAFAMELKLDSSIAQEVKNALVGDEDYDLHALIADSTYQRLDSLLSKRFGMGLFFFGRLKPMYLYMLLSQQGLKQDRAVFLDQYFMEQARGQGMKTIGIETVSEQLTALDYLSLQKQAALLEKAVWQKAQEVSTEKLVETYAKEDLDSLHAMIRAGMADTAFYKALIVDRNLRMARRISGYIHNQPTFIAVGAGHLTGKQGLISLLQEKGYKVKPVLSKRKSPAPANGSGSRERWKRFKSDTSGFSVLFPGEPKHTMNTVPTEQGNLNVHQYTWKNEESRRQFFVTYNQYPYDFYHEKMEEKIQDNLPKQLNADLLDSRLVEINDITGHRVILQDEQDKYIIVTYFLQGRELFQLMVSGFGNSFEEVDEPKFFRSFEFVD